MLGVMAVAGKEERSCEQKRSLFGACSHGYVASIVGRNDIVRLIYSSYMISFSSSNVNSSNLRSSSTSSAAAVLSRA